MICPPCQSGISWLSFDSPLPFQPNPLTLSVLSFVLLMVHSPAFLQTIRKYNYFVLKRVRLVCMALVEQLQNGWWYVQLVALWHWYLPLRVYIV